MEKNGYYGKVDEKPATERELFQLQDELFVKREKYNQEIKEWLKDTSKPRPVDESIVPWTKMFEILYSYASSLVKKKAKGKKYIEPEDVSAYAMDATFRLMSMFNRKPEYAVGASFAGILGYKVLELINEAKLISLNKPTSYDAQVELLDTLTEDSFTHIGGSRNLMLSPEEIFLASEEDPIGEVLDELDQEVGRNSKIAFLARLYLLVNLRVPRTRHIKRLFIENWAQDYKVEQVLESTVLEVYNRLSDDVGHILV